MAANGGAAATPPTGTWLVASSRRGHVRTDDPYPCQCSKSAKGCNPRFCYCAGRTDLDNAPSTCCAHKHPPAEHPGELVGWMFRWRGRR